MKEDLLNYNNREKIIIKKCKLKPNARSFNVDKMTIYTESGCEKQTAKKFRSIYNKPKNVDSDCSESESQNEPESPSQNEPGSMSLNSRGTESAVADVPADSKVF